MAAVVPHQHGHAGFFQRRYQLPASAQRVGHRLFNDGRHTVLCARQGARHMQVVGRCQDDTVRLVTHLRKQCIQAFKVCNTKAGSKVSGRGRGVHHSTQLRARVGFNQFDMATAYQTCTGHGQLENAGVF